MLISNCCVGYGLDWIRLESEFEVEGIEEVEEQRWSRQRSREREREVRKKIVNEYERVIHSQASNSIPQYKDRRQGNKQYILTGLTGTSPKPKTPSPPKDNGMGT